MSTDEQVTLTGSCMCGEVRYRITGPLREVVNCHCEPCRQFTGHYLAATAVSTKDIFFQKQKTLPWSHRTPTV